jgi:phosphatidylinositol glycan class A protein
VETGFITKLHAHERDDNKIRLVLVSRMVFRRGIDILIEMLPALCQRNPDIIIEVVGDGAKVKPLKEVIRIKGLEDRTVMHGGLPNKQAL